MPQNIHKHRVRASFLKSLASYNQHAQVQARMADNLVKNLQTLRKTSTLERVFEIGCGTGLFTAQFLKQFQPTHYYANDLVLECEPIITELVKQYHPKTMTFIGGDVEGMTNFPAPVDAIISNATFQWLADIKAFLPKIKRLLKPGGVLAFSMFEAGNLWEIKQLTGNGLPYLTCTELQAQLTKHFQVHYCVGEVMTLCFPSPRAVLKHLRFTGVNGLSPQTWTKSSLRAFEYGYQERFGCADYVPLTYRPIFCIVEKESN